MIEYQGEVCQYTKCYCEENSLLLARRLLLGSSAAAGRADVDDDDGVDAERGPGEEVVVVGGGGGGAAVATVVGEEQEQGHSHETISALLRKFPRVFVVFVSNTAQSIPLWHQRAGELRDDGMVVWDYHVFCLVLPPDGPGVDANEEIGTLTATQQAINDSARVLIFDLDTTLPFPCDIKTYTRAAIRHTYPLQSRYRRFFRLVPASQALRLFASDRRHMKVPLPGRSNITSVGNFTREDGTTRATIEGSEGWRWASPPPPWPCLQGPAAGEVTHNLELFLDMTHPDPIMVRREEQNNNTNDNDNNNNNNNKKNDQIDRKSKSKENESLLPSSLAPPVSAAAAAAVASTGDSISSSVTRGGGARGNEEGGGEENSVNDAGEEFCRPTMMLDGAETREGRLGELTPPPPPGVVLSECEFANLATLGGRQRLRQACSSLSHTIR